MKVSSGARVILLLQPLEDPLSPAETLLSLRHGHGCAMGPSPAASSPSLVFSQVSFTPHLCEGRWLSGHPPWRSPPGPLHPTVHRVSGKQKVLNWCGGEQGTSGSCVVTRSWSPPHSKTRMLVVRCAGHGLCVHPCKTARLCFDAGGKFPVWPGIWGAGDSNTGYAQ